MLAIEATSLVKRYGRHPVVNDVTLQVQTGSVFGFLGPNGAGKTTFMRLLLGLVSPDAGSVRLLDRDLARDRRAALAHVGAFIESPGLYPHLTGRANLALTAGLLALPPAAIDRALEVVDLRAAAGQRVGTYSLGMKQRLALARALLGSPQLLFLDEPSNGLDPDGMIAMRELIRDLPARTGATVFLSSHLLAEMEHVCTDVALMRRGKLVLTGSVSELTHAARHLRILVDDPVRSAVLLRSLGVEVDTSRAERLLVAMPKDRDPTSAAAWINRSLVEAGLSVMALEWEGPTLEQLYSRCVGNQAMAIAA